MVTGVNMILKALKDYRKFRYKFKGYLLALVALIAVIYFTASIVLNNIQLHEVEILDKSPVYPYHNYDYMTTEDVYYSIDNTLIEVPAYFRTDFASIPKLFWFIEAPYKASLIYPAIWHDYMYSCSTNKTRKQIDDTFFWLLRYEQNSLLTSLKMYMAVRLFGGYYFDHPGTCGDMIIQIEKDKAKFHKENPDG